MHAMHPLPVRPRIHGATLALLLALGLAPLAPAAARADDTPPLRLGEEVVLLTPRAGALLDRVGFKAVFDEAGPEHRAAAAILGCGPFARAVRDYRAMQRVGTGEPKKPLYVALEEGLAGVSFCTVQPIVIFAGEGRRRADLAVVIHISGRAIDGLASGKGGPGAWLRPHETLCHEAGHAIMAAAYLHTHDLDLGPERWAKLAAWGGSPEAMIAGVTGEGHYKSKRTDPPFALSEGFAEYCGAYYTGRPVGVDLGKIDLDDMRRTEGAVAALLRGVADALPGDGHERVLEVLAGRPPSAIDLLLDLRGIDEAHRAAVDRGLEQASGGRFALPDRYPLVTYLRDFAPNGERLVGIVRERLRALRQRVEPAAEPERPRRRAKPPTGKPELF